MVLTVTATGNHYFVDSIGGVAAALAAMMLVAAIRRARSKRMFLRKRCRVSVSSKLMHRAAPLSFFLPVYETERIGRNPYDLGKFDQGVRGPAPQP